MEFLKQEGFIDKEGNFNHYNEQEIEFGEALIIWADKNGLAYDIDSNHVFDSIALDIYCYSFAYWDDRYEEIHANLFTVYCC